MARQRRTFDDQMVDLATRGRNERAQLFSTPAMAPVGPTMIEDNAILNEHLSQGAVALENLEDELQTTLTSLEENEEILADATQRLSTSEQRIETLFGEVGSVPDQVEAAKQAAILAAQAYTDANAGGVTPEELEAIRQDAQQKATEAKLAAIVQASQDAADRIDRTIPKGRFDVSKVQDLAASDSPYVDTGTLSIRTDGSPDGPNYLRFTEVAGNTRDTALVLPDVPVTPGKTYQMGFWARQTGGGIPTRGIGWPSQWRKNDGTVHNGDWPKLFYAADYANKLTKDWQYFTAQFTAPQGMKAFIPRFFAYSGAVASGTTIDFAGLTLVSTLDLGLLTAGTAVISDAVAQKIAAGTAAFQKADIGNLTVTGDTHLSDAVARTIAADTATFIKLNVGSLVADKGTLDSALINQLYSQVVESRLIRASMLELSGKNMVRDPDFLDAAVNAERLSATSHAAGTLAYGKDNVSASGILTFTEHSTTYRTICINGNVTNAKIPVTKGDIVYLSVMFRVNGTAVSGAAASQVRFSIYEDAATGAYIRHVGVDQYRTVYAGGGWLAHTSQYTITNDDVRYIRPNVQMRNPAWTGGLDIKWPTVEVAPNLSMREPSGGMDRIIEARLGLTPTFNTFGGTSRTAGLEFRILNTDGTERPDLEIPARITGGVQHEISMQSGASPTTAIDPATVKVAPGRVDIVAGIQNDATINMTAPGGVRVNGAPVTQITEFKVSGSKAHFDVNNQDVAALTYVAAGSNVASGTVATPGSGRVTVNQDGIYGIDFQLLFTTAMKGRTFAQISDGSGNAYNRTTIAVGEDQTCASVSGKYLTAGSVVRFMFIQSNGVTLSYNGVIRVTKYQ